MTQPNDDDMSLFRKLYPDLDLDDPENIKALQDELLKDYLLHGDGLARRSSLPPKPDDEEWRTIIFDAGDTLKMHGVATKSIAIGGVSKKQATHLRGSATQWAREWIESAGIRSDDVDFKFSPFQRTEEVKPRWSLVLTLVVRTAIVVEVPQPDHEWWAESIEKTKSYIDWFSANYKLGL